MVQFEFLRHWYHTADLIRLDRMDLTIRKKATIVLACIVVLLSVVFLLKTKPKMATSSQITYACEEEGKDGYYTGKIFFRRILCDQRDCEESYYNEQRNKIIGQLPNVRCNKSILNEDFLAKNKTYSEFINLEDIHYKKYFSFLKKFRRCVTDDQQMVYEVSQGFLDTSTSSFYDSNGVSLGSFQSGMIGETQKKPSFQVTSCQEITEDFFKLRTGVILKESQE